MTTSGARGSGLDLCQASSFAAENVPITVVPAFHLPSELPLLSCPTTKRCGPFVAGMPTEVPLWMAKLLAQRRLAQIQPPQWLESEGLSELLRRERETTVLTSDLPFHYYEIARSLSSVIDKPTLVVLQDLVAVRVDKIRRHFHDLSRGDLSDGEMHMITITGMGSVELNRIGPFLRRAFSDYGYLIRKSKDDEEEEGEGAEGGERSAGGKVVEESQRALSGRGKLRRFRPTQ